MIDPELFLLWLLWVLACAPTLHQFGNPELLSRCFAEIGADLSHIPPAHLWVMCALWLLLLIAIVPLVYVLDLVKFLDKTPSK